MSKTRDRIYADQYRAGRHATRWERFKWLLFHHGAKIEEWQTDYTSKDMDFLIVVFMTVTLALAGIVIAFAARG